MIDKNMIIGSVGAVSILVIASIFMNMFPNWSMSIGGLGFLSSSLVAFSSIEKSELTK